MNCWFETPLQEDDGEISGPLRTPLQMLGDQSYDAHASIHDDSTAQKLGFKAGTIEGPTHFSQFDPIGVKLFGDAWFTHGCISAHFRHPAFEGDRLRAFARRDPQEPARASIRLMHEDGREMLTGSLSVGPQHPQTALDTRLANLSPLDNPIILADVRPGMTRPRQPVMMGRDQHMGHLYPFSLARKLERITEPSPAYADGNTWGGAIIPFEMLSVLFCYTNKDDPFPVRGPAVGLFVDEEIRLLDGPVYAGKPYEVEREVVALSGSRRTESMWVRSTLYPAGKTKPVATMLLNLASLKSSYHGYEESAA